MRVTILHNIARDQHNRPIHFDGYQPGHPLVPVFTYHVDILDGGPEIDLIAEQAFTMFNADPDFLTGAQRDLALSYRARRLRSLSKGDVVQVGDIALACASVGFHEVAGELNRTRESVHGTHPITGT